MAAQKGTVGVVFGVAGSTSLVVFSVDGSNTTANNSWTVISSYDYSAEMDEKEVRNATGDVVNLTAYNRVKRLTVEAVPTGTTMAVALATALQIPCKHDLVNITGASDTQINGDTGNNTAWIVDGATKRATNDGEVRCTFNLKRYAADLDPIAT